MQTLDLLDQLLRFETTRHRSNLPLIDFVEAFLTTRGFKTRRVIDEQEEKAGLLCTLGPEGSGVLLAAHSDVMDVVEQDWTRPPFELSRDGDRLFGCGTSESKGFLAAMLRLADNAAGKSLKEPLKFSISYDRKFGCTGVKKMAPHIEAFMGLPRFCVVGGATAMNIAISHDSSAVVSADCRGTPGQLQNAPRFVSALGLAEEFIDELRAIEAEYAEDVSDNEDYIYSESSIVAGVLAENEALNVVPDFAQVRFEFLSLAPDMQVGLRSLVERAAKNVTTRYAAADAEFEIDIGFLDVCPRFEVDEDAKVVFFVKDLIAAHKTVRLPFGTEAGVFSGLGVPTVVCGPGTRPAAGRGPDEFVYEKDLQACDIMLDKLLDSLVN